LSELPYLTADLPGVAGRLKERPEDFVVEEIPAYLPCGEGEHLFLWVEKIDVPADELARHLARTLDVSRDDIGVAGLKDRRAISRQFVSVPARAAERIDAANSDSVRVVSATRHTNKLKTGHLKGNTFSILLRAPLGDFRTEADEARLQAATAIVERLRAIGVPNYYGEQRFGIGGETAILGFELLRGSKTTRDIPYAKRKFLLRLALSAAQSELFNAALADRMSRGELRTVLAGDVLRKVETGGLFTAIDAATEQARLDAGEVQITGPIFGPKMQQPSGEVALREAALLDASGLTLADFSRYPKLTTGTRRPYLIGAAELSVTAEAEGLRFTFALPAGAYATVLLREIMKSG
jgi:tRNA pseudouridine13 synthase